METSPAPKSAETVTWSFLWVCCCLCLLIGLCAGWLLGYTRPASVAQRKMVNDYRKIKTELHTSDIEMGNFARNVPQYIRELRRSDEYAAFLALGVFEAIQKKKDKDTEKACATILANYYNAWATNGADPSMIDAIDKLADKYPLLNDAIATNTVSATNAAAK